MQQQTSNAKKFILCWTITWLVSHYSYRVIQAAKFGFSPAAAFSDTHFFVLTRIVCCFSLAAFLGFCSLLVNVVVNKVAGPPQKDWLIGSAIILLHTISYVLYTSYYPAPIYSHDHTSQACLTILIYVSEVTLSTLIAVRFVASKKTQITEGLYSSLVVVTAVAASFVFYFSASPPTYYLGLWNDPESPSLGRSFMIASFKDNREGYIQLQIDVYNPATKKVILNTIFAGNIRWTGSVNSITLYKTEGRNPSSNKAFATGNLSQDARYMRIKLVNDPDVHRLQRR